MKKIISSILLSVSILFLTSCEEDPVTNSKILNNYTPYKVGAYWFYKFSTTVGSVLYLKKEVIRKESNGYYLIKESNYGINTSSNDTTIIIDTGYVRITSEGLMVNIPNENDMYILKKPYKKGTTWSYQYSDSTIFNMEIVEDSLTYETPVRTFNLCLKVNIWWNNPFDPLWEYIFAPNVGIVKYGPYILESYNIP